MNFAPSNEKAVITSSESCTTSMSVDNRRGNPDIPIYEKARGLLIKSGTVALPQYYKRTVSQSDLPLLYSQYAV